jgi:low affinity Fe/Cu permease
MSDVGTFVSRASFATDSLCLTHVSFKPSQIKEGESMKPPTIEAPELTVHGHFGRFAAAVSGWLGSTWAFAGAGLVVVAWIATGPLFHFSNNWAMVISTGTSIATFLMVFLIQNTQNRDARAIHLKLNELIRAMDKARNQLIDIEKLSDLELDEMQSTYEKIKTSWTERQKPGSRGAQEK